MSGPHDEVIIARGNMPGEWTGHGKLETIGGFEGEPIGDIGECNHGIEEMIAVSPAPRDAERQIDFRARQLGDGRRHQPLV